MATKISSFNSIEEFDESDYLNNETFIHYYNRLKMMITSLFKWDNLPNNIPERYIENSLFDNAQVAFYEDSNFGFIVTKCTQLGTLNLYNEPLSWVCYSDNGFYQHHQSDDIEIIRNNKQGIATYFLIQHHLKRLFNIERTIDTNLYHQRNPIIIKSPESQRLTLKNLMKQYDGHSHLIYGTDKLDLKNLEILDLKVPFCGLELEDLKDRKWNDLINMFGINTANTQKKERLVTDEANANNQLVQLCADVMLAERQIAVERINERYGLDIEVSLRAEMVDSLTLEQGGNENE